MDSIKWLFDPVALVWIGWFAWQNLGFLLRNDLYIYGDHPGQFYRLWQLLAVTWPEQGRLIGWAPHWYAGEPALQFYPPGFALLGWLLWQVSWQKLSLFWVYEIIVFTNYLIPPICFYLLLAWGLRDRLAGLVAAWLALTFPFPLGGVQGVLIGMVGNQLAFGLGALVILTGVWGMQSGPQAKPNWNQPEVIEPQRTPRAQRLLCFLGKFVPPAPAIGRGLRPCVDFFRITPVLPWLVTGLLLAATLLLHTYQIFFPLLVLGLYTLLAGPGRLHRLGWLVGVGLLALGLTAWWWLPLAGQRDYYLPLVEATLPQILDHLNKLWLNGLVLLTGAALLGAFFRPNPRRALVLSLLLGGGAMLIFILINQAVLVERYEIFTLDSVRLLPAITLTLFVGLAVGVSELAWVGTRLLAWRGWGAAGLPLVILVPWLVYSQIPYDFAAWIANYQPRPGRTPLFLREAEAKYGLSEAWQVMARTPGRVLFTSYYSLLFDVPTTLKALTPYLTGREIVGGTFTLHSPVASYIWVGQTQPAVLRDRVEAQDDKTLAGVSWETMSEEFLFDLCRRFNMTLIAATAADVQARAFLERTIHFKPVWSNPLFTFYEVTGYTPAWVEATAATIKASQYEKTAIEVEIANAQPGATLEVKVAQYPGWQAEANGQSLSISPDKAGLMQVALPPGNYTVQLHYGPGRLEYIGTLISLVTIVLAVGLSIQRIVLVRRK